MDQEMNTRAQQAVDDLASKGYRTLGVARSEDSGPWQFLGILPLFDPPREDSAQTIADAEKHGIEIKMVTGDDVAIGREIAPTPWGRTFSLRPNFSRKTGYRPSQRSNDHKIEQADGLPGFFRNISTASSGLCSPGAYRWHDRGWGERRSCHQASRRGVAVSGATDAARAAADLVLTAPGLSVIVTAVEEARKIFERMNSYAIYRIVETSASCFSWCWPWSSIIFTPSPPS